VGKGNIRLSCEGDRGLEEGGVSSRRERLFEPQEKLFQLVSENAKRKKTVEAKNSAQRRGKRGGTWNEKEWATKKKRFILSSDH